jgi:hypothetical protein
MGSPPDKPSPAELKRPKPRFRPNEDEDRNAVEGRPSEGGVGREPPGIQKEIAAADEAARQQAGTKEPVRNTPPAGDWNDTTD